MLIDYQADVRELLRPNPSKEQIPEVRENLKEALRGMNQNHRECICGGLYDLASQKGLRKKYSLDKVLEKLPKPPAIESQTPELAAWLTTGAIALAGTILSGEALDYIDADIHRYLSHIAKGIGAIASLGIGAHVGDKVHKYFSGRKEEKYPSKLEKFHKNLEIYLIQ